MIEANLIRWRTINNFFQLKIDFQGSAKIMRYSICLEIFQAKIGIIKFSGSINIKLLKVPNNFLQTLSYNQTIFLYDFIKESWIVK